MYADNQGLGQRDPLPGHVIRDLAQHVGGVGEVLAHGAVAVDAQTVEGLAAVGFALGTGVALPAVQVGVQHHMVALLNAVLVVLVHVLYNTGGLVADDDGVGGDVHIGSPEGGYIGAADAGGHYLDKSIALLQFRLGQFYDGCLTGSLNLNAFHSNSPFFFMIMM